MHENVSIKQDYNSSFSTKWAEVQVNDPKPSRSYLFYYHIPSKPSVFMQRFRHKA